MAEKKPGRKSAVDWDAMESDWRAGIKTKLQLSKEYGVSRPAMDKHWGKLGIERDLTAKIRQEAESKVALGEVAHEVAPVTKIPEREVIEVNAEMLAGVMRGHRGLTKQLRETVEALLAEVNQLIRDRELFAQVGELCYAPDEDGVDRLNELYRKVTALPTQADVVKKLAETIRILVELERKIFRIEDAVDPVEAAARGAAQGAAEGAAKTADQMAKLRALVEKDAAAGVAG